MLRVRVKCASLTATDLEEGRWGEEERVEWEVKVDG